MGAKSTIDITKGQAIAFIMKCIDDVDNETLANLVEELNDGLLQKGDYENTLGLCNFRIIAD
jgi:hypothetical protein